MKFKIVKAKFLDGLKSVQNIVAGKGSIPVLQNVLLEANANTLKIVTTDLDISIKVKLECEVIEEGETTLPVKLLFNAITKVCDGEVEVEVDSRQRASITAGNAKYKIAGISASEFPKLPVSEETFSYKIQQQTFKEMLRKVAYAASQDDTRRTLKGVLVSFKNSKIIMVATDGRRLAMVENEIEFPQNEEKDIVLPSKAVSELQRSLNGQNELSLSVQKSQICFTLDNITIYSKLIEDVYPNYKQVIPAESKKTIVVDRQLLLDALERASVMTMDEAHSTKLSFDNSLLTVSSAESDIGEAKDEVVIKYAGEKIDIIFNPSYVMDALKAIDDDEITINLNDGHSPAVIRCSIPFIYVLMPLRIS